MADWTDILDSSVEPLAPVTSELMTALRDNPIAISEGSPDAPRNQTASLDLVADSSNTGTNAGGSVLMSVDTGRSADWLLMVSGLIRLNTTDQLGSSSISFEGSNNNSTFTAISDVLTAAGVEATFNGSRLLQSGSDYRYYRLFATGDGDHSVALEASLLPLGAPNV